MAALQAMTGMVAYVANPSATADFYRKAGFTIDKHDADRVAVSLGDFWMDFHRGSAETKPEFALEANAPVKGAGLYLYFRVTQIDNFYQHLLEKGIVTSSEPRDWPWGNREFVVRDPDGYKLVFYQKL